MLNKNTHIQATQTEENANNSKKYLTWLSLTITLITIISVFGMVGSIWRVVDTQKQLTQVEQTLSIISSLWEGGIVITNTLLLRHISKTQQKNRKHNGVFITNKGLIWAYIDEAIWLVVIVVCYGLGIGKLHIDDTPLLFIAVVLNTIHVFLVYHYIEGRFMKEIDEEALKEEIKNKGNK